MLIVSQVMIIPSRAMLEYEVGPEYRKIQRESNIQSTRSKFIAQWRVYTATIRLRTMRGDEY